MLRYKLSILIAEDKEYMQNLIEKYILTNPTKSVYGVEIDYFIDICNTAEEAILRYTGGEHDIVIMDLGFDNGEFNGIDATKEILEVNPNANIIGMASEGEADVDIFKCSGLKFFLEKMFQDSILWNKIDILSDLIISDLLSEDYCETKNGFLKKKINKRHDK